MFSEKFGVVVEAAGVPATVSGTLELEGGLRGETNLPGCMASKPEPEARPLPQLLFT